MTTTPKETREAFECLALENGCEPEDLLMNSAGAYVDAETNFGWFCYQAALTHTEQGSDRMREALEDAATSLNTIAICAGKDEYLDNMQSVRGYANSRYQVALAALSAVPEQAGKSEITASDLIHGLCLHGCGEVEHAGQCKPAETRYYTQADCGCEPNEACDICQGRPAQPSEKVLRDAGIREALACVVDSREKHKRSSVVYEGTPDGDRSDVAVHVLRYVIDKIEALLSTPAQPSNEHSKTEEALGKWQRFGWIFIDVTGENPVEFHAVDDPESESLAKFVTTNGLWRVNEVFVPTAQPSNEQTVRQCLEKISLLNPHDPNVDQLDMSLHNQVRLHMAETGDTARAALAALQHTSGKGEGK